MGQQKHRRSSLSKRSAVILVAMAGVSLFPVVDWFIARAAAEPENAQSLAALGERLFFDPELSLNRTQACATCHAPDAGFVDPRETRLGRAVSLGDDGESLGRRNAPTVTYASFSPTFGRNADGQHVGGQFLDGRARTLEEQAGQPLLNPVEMAMPDEASVVARLQEDAEYVSDFRDLFGADVFNSTRTAFDALARSLAAYERTAAFAPFDSRYDRSLRGEIELTDEEELGRLLFFSSQFTNCHLCHQLNEFGGTAGETFSNYVFHNIGTSANPSLAKAFDALPDRGLAENPAVADRMASGKFKTPSLRNIAVTGPYMHNGVFRDLRTVILFYDHYNNKAPRRQINPETGGPWGVPEIPDNLSLKELETGPALDDRRVDALVAFLRSLTDQRYEHLLKGP